MMTKRSQVSGVCLSALLLTAGCAASSGAPGGETAAADRGGDVVTGGTRAGRAALPPQRVWVALESGRKLARVDVRSGGVLKKVEVSGGPHNLVVNGEGTLAAALWYQQRVVVLRNGRVKHVFLGGAPHDVKMGGGRIVVANQGSNRLHTLSPRGEPRAQIPLTHDPHDIALSPGGDIVWATLEGTDRLAKVSLERKEVLRYVPTGRSPHDILFSPTGRLWVSDWNGAIHVFTRRGRHVMSRSLGQEAHHLAFTPNGKQAWITDHAAGRVFVLVAKTLKILKAFPIKGAPHHVTITRDGNKAVVADHERGMLVVYRTATLRRTGKIPVGEGPHGIWNAP